MALISESNIDYGEYHDEHEQPYLTAHDIGTEDVTAYDFLEKNRVFASKARARYYYQLIEIIFEQISKDDYWEITLDFIRDLGATYSLMLARRHTEFCGM